MSKTNKNKKKVIAENEIIIGVTTKPKEIKKNKKTATRKTAKNKTTRTSLKKNEKNNKKTKIVKEKKDTEKELQIKKINKKRNIISIIVLLFICLASCIYFLTTPIFNIANIEISGNKKNSVETYISLTKIELNSTNIFAITKNNVIKNIKENSYVQDVEVKRKLPNIVQIKITERKPAYQAEYNNNTLYIDNQGYILEINEKKGDYIELLGLTSTIEILDEGQRLNKEDLLKLDTVLKIVNYFNYNSIESKITSINIADTSNFIVNLDKEGKIVYLGNETKLNEKILKLKTILEKEKGNKGEIFIDEDAINRNRIYFKPTKGKE